MISNRVLFAYLFRIYTNYFLFICLLLSSILLLSNIFDSLQRFKSIYIQTHVFWSMVFYKIPYLMSEVSPLISFIAMLFFLRALIMHNELIAILGNGLSIWRIIYVPILATILFGAVITCIIGPVGAYGLSKYEELEAKILKKKQSKILVSEQGILFFEQNYSNSYIIQAKTINLETAELKNLLILEIDKDNKLLARIDAETAHLKPEKFELQNVIKYAQQKIVKHNWLALDTNIEINDFINNFTPPEKIAIWQLSSTIKKISRAGLPKINYQIYYFKQLFKPLLMAATIILAACFFSLRVRDNSQNKMFVIGLIVGFVVYAVLEISGKMLAFSGFTPVLAVMLPILLLAFVSNFIILNLH